VPPLPDAGKGGQVAASMRDRMEAHRKNPVCAGCHARMDPLGFAFENFDGIGKWRTREANMPINASGTFPNGAKFDGPAEFVRGLVSQRDEFVRTFADKLLTYALGRGAAYYDQPAIRKIVREAAPSEYRWSSLILGVIKSAPFQMRMVGTAPATVAGRP
jgi:hypothetical protein